MKCYKMRAWSLAKTKLGICVEGLCEDDPSTSVVWHSSEIVKRINARLLESSSGNQYELVGSMSKASCSAKNFPSSTLKKFQNGFPVNWKKLLQKKTSQQNMNAVKKIDSAKRKKKDTRTMSKVMRTDNNGYESDCLTAFESNDLIESTRKMLNFRGDSDDEDLLQFGQIVRKRLDFDSEDARTEEINLCSRRVIPILCSTHEVSDDALTLSFTNQPTLANTCRLPSKTSENLQVSEDCLVNDSIHVEPRFSGEKLPKVALNIVDTKNPSVFQSLNSKPRCNKHKLENNKKSKPQEIPKSNKGNVELRSKRSFRNKTRESSPKRLKLQSQAGASVASSGSLKSISKASRSQAPNLSDNRIIIEHDSRTFGSPKDVSFDALTQSFGPSTAIATCLGLTNKTLDNVTLNVSQDCLVNDSFYETPCSADSNFSEAQPAASSAGVGSKSKGSKQKKQSNKNGRMKRKTKKRQDSRPEKLQTEFESKVENLCQKNLSCKPENLESNIKIQTPSTVTESSRELKNLLKKKSASKKIKLQKQSKIKKKLTKVEKENKPPDFRIPKGKTTLRKNRAFKKVMMDCLKAKGNGHDYFANITQQTEDCEAAKVLAMFDGGEEMSEIHFDLTSSVFSKSDVDLISKTTNDSMPSTMNDTAAVLLMRTPRASRDADLEMFRMNRIMKGKETIELGTRDSFLVQNFLKYSAIKNRLELPDDAFNVKETTEEESDRDDYFDETLM